MAYLDHDAAAYDKKANEVFETFKQKLRAERQENEESEMILSKIIGMEIENENIKAKVERYQKFFITLRELIPRQPSIHDVLH